MRAFTTGWADGMQVYNIAAGRTIPRWLDDKKKKSLRRDEDYRKRVEILQVQPPQPS